MLHRRRLRSASTEQLDLDLPNCRRSTIGGRAFPVAGTKVWNGLPSDVRLYVGLVAVGVQEQAEDILVPPLLRNCLTLNYIFPSHYLIYLPSRTVVLGIVFTV